VKSWDFKVRFKSYSSQDQVVTDPLKRTVVTSGVDTEERCRTGVISCYRWRKKEMGVKGRQIKPTVRYSSGTLQSFPSNFCF